MLLVTPTATVRSATSVVLFGRLLAFGAKRCFCRAFLSFCGLGHVFCLLPNRRTVRFMARVALGLLATSVRSAEKVMWHWKSVVVQASDDSFK